jgi:hypothetical protein
MYYKSLLKGITPRDFGVLFIISLDSYEVRTWAGQSLFFILMLFSYLNFTLNIILFVSIFCKCINNIAIYN